MKDLSVLTLLLFIIFILIWLQIKLSKNKNNGLGLILPVTSALISLIVVPILHRMDTVNLTKYTTIPQSEHSDTIIAHINETIVKLSEIAHVYSLYIFIIMNIPTLVFILIYFSFKKKSKHIQNKTHHFH